VGGPQLSSANLNTQTCGLTKFLKFANVAFCGFVICEPNFLVDLLLWQIRKNIIFLLENKGSDSNLYKKFSKNKPAEKF
jgi:hypothetical protein